MNPQSRDTPNTQITLSKVAQNLSRKFFYFFNFLLLNPENYFAHTTHTFNTITRYDTIHTIIHDVIPLNTSKAFKSCGRSERVDDLTPRPGGFPQGFGRGPLEGGP